MKMRGIVLVTECDKGCVKGCEEIDFLLLYKHFGFYEFCNVSLFLILNQRNCVPLLFRSPDAKRKLIQNPSLILDVTDGTLVRVRLF